MTSQKIAIGIVAVVLFAGVVTAHAADFSAGEKTYDLYRQLAEQGNAAAQYNLGLMYEKSRGVAQDYVQAHMWYNLAAAKGEKRARKLRDSLAERMTPEQIAEAQRLAREWKPKGK
jgi:TPR repeat protein